MNKKLIELVAGVLRVSASQLDMKTGPTTQPAWDSLAHVTIVAAVEETYGITLSMPEILAIKSIGDLDGVIQNKSKAG